MVRVIAVVVSYNGSRWIRRCLSSLVRDETFELDILLVDNCSQDDTVATVKREFPDVTVVKLDRNVGFGRANNIGFELALENGHEHVFLLNQDAWISHGSIGDLARLQQHHGEYGIISPIHLTGDGDTLDVLFGKYTSPMYCPGLYADALLGKLQQLYKVRFVNAAAWLISRRCLSTVGGFDPIFPHYGEDSDYVFRGLRHGFKVGVTPTVFVHHDRPQVINANGAIDVYRQYIACLVDLKRADWSMRFAAVTVIKRVVDQIGTSALCGEFKKSMDLFRVLLRISKILPKVAASRREIEQDDCPYLSLAGSGSARTELK